MMTQQALPGFVTPDLVVGATIQERAEAWVAANPWVLDELERLADERVRDGVTRFGVKALVERLRWDWSKRRTEGDKWAWNNTHTSRLSRMLIERRPDLEPFIETRELKAA